MNSQGVETFGRVLVTRRIPQSGIDLLTQHGLEVDVWPEDRPMPYQALVERSARCAGLLSMISDRIDAALLTHASQLRVVANYGVGYNNIDVTAASARGVYVTNTPDVLTEATADLTWALILAAARRVGEAERALRTGSWNGWGPMQFLGHDVSGKTLGIVGAGRIGSAVARRAAGFAMRIVYTHPRVHPVLENECRAERLPLDVLLAQSDVVSLHVYLDAQTVHLIGTRELSLMKPTAILVNTSRGPVIDEAALVRALREGTIAGAGLDVYEDEPRLAAGLIELENVVLLPHIGSGTVETRSRMAELAAHNVIAVLNGQRPLSPVNAPGKP